MIDRKKYSEVVKLLRDAKVSADSAIELANKICDLFDDNNVVFKKETISENPLLRTVGPKQSGYVNKEGKFVPVVRPLSSLVPMAKQTGE